MSQNEESTVRDASPAPSGEALDLRVYELVRERIIDGTLQPGARIRERELAEELQISRIPIREAFPRLESEGFIKTLHRRGAVVAQMTVRDVEELFAVRLSLEVLAARLAAEECARGASPDRLIASLDAAGAAVHGGATAHGGGHAAIAALTSSFHDEILVLSSNQLLQNLMIPVEGRIRRLFHLVADRDEEQLHREHRDLCLAIGNGQTELAGSLAFAHVERSRFETMPVIESLLAR